jgi:hypothetical protein
VPHVLQISDSNLPPDSIHFRAVTAWGRVLLFFWVLVMGTEHLPRNKQRRLAEPSLWVVENTDNAVSLHDENALRGDEPSLWGDEHSDDMHSLLEENVRLRGVIVQLSSIILRNAASPK